MEFNEIESSSGQSGYDSMVWVSDDKGHEFSCTLEQARGGVRSLDDLSERERASCVDVNAIVGTERW